MLDRIQREVLAAFFVARLPVNPGVAQLAVFIGDDIARELPLLPTVKSVADWAIDRAMTQLGPDTLIGLIRAVDDGTEALRTIVDVADNLAGNTQAWVEWRNVEVSGGNDPLHVHDGRPFVDRAQFRSFLPRVDAAETPNCILVEGSMGSGKTYLHEYLKKLANVRRSFEVGFTAVGSSSGRSMSPQIAARAVAAGLKINFQHQPREHEDPHRYARNLATWIIEEAPDRSAPSIAVFDGFDATGVTEPMHTFIENLIGGIQDDEEAQKRLRVLLLGYDVGRLEERDLGFERCTLEHVDRPHIEEWLRKRFPGHPEYRYEDTAEWVIDQIPQGGETRLLQLCSLVQAASAQF